MKTVLQFTFLMLCSIMLTAQSSVDIKINHMLDGLQFENGSTASNDLGNDFMIDRLQYYLSGFAIVHDGGQVTDASTKFALISLLESSESTIINLGEFEFESIEGVRFYFGINEQANHADPSMWPMSHPLAPQFPSMHWGWASGYRFIALEGLSGPNVDQEMQFHLIGDEFYTQMEYPLLMSGESSYTLELDAEYKNILQGIDVSSGIIIHGGTDEIVTLASNMGDNVFTAAVVNSANDSEYVDLFEVYPNPVTEGIINIKTDLSVSNTTIRVHDALGRVVYYESQSPSAQLEIDNAGIYFISIADNSGQVLATRKVVVQ